MINTLAARIFFFFFFFCFFFAFYFRSAVGIFPISAAQCSKP